MINFANRKSHTKITEITDMAKKTSTKSKALTAAAAIVAAGAGLASSPAGQQTAEQLMEQAAQTTQVIQKKNPQRSIRSSQQQAQQQQGRTITNNATAAYLPYAGCGSIFGMPSISPKEYGEYLARSGKNKQNIRKRKHYAKAWG